MQFRNKTDPGHADDHIRDLDRSRCEIRAYCTLKRSKLCDAGVVPNFYGFMLAVDPANCAHLDAFRHDKGLPRPFASLHLCLQNIPITVNIGDAATIIDNYRSDTAFHCAHSCQLAPIDRDVCPCGVRLMASDGMSGAQDTI
jgi:hypothetical protein